MTDPLAANVAVATGRLIMVAKGQGTIMRIAVLRKEV